MDDQTPEQTKAGSPLRSASIGELVKALAEAQAEIRPPTKSKTGKVSGTNKKGDRYEYEYKYADLADVVEAYRQPFAKRGLVVSHALYPVDGHTILRTTLFHVSNEFIASEFPIPAIDKPQEMGSYVSYAKRYNVSGLTDLVAEDDDDGKRAQDSERRPAETQDAAPPSGDVAAILDLAAELQQRKGGTIEGIVKDASSFPGKDGNMVFFDDPTRVRKTSVKWLASTRKKLEGQLAKLDSASEPAASDSAELFQ